MFAGAAREAVFSNPAVIERVRAGFVPVALKAGLVASSQGQQDPELRRYGPFARTMPAPQGIGVATPEGRPVAWALSFDDDAAVLAFLDHAGALARDRSRSDTEVYERYPSRRRPDATPGPIEEPTTHEGDAHCPAHAHAPPGSLAARVVGRAFDATGRPVGSTRQEDYVEDRFDLSPGAATQLVLAARGAATTGEARLPDEVVGALVDHAYLGQLDVAPTTSPVPGGRVLTNRRDLTLKRGADGTLVLRGTSALESTNEGGMGVAASTHAVTLEWEGTLELDGDTVKRWVVVARGREALRIDQPDPALKDRAHVRALPAGHAVDLDAQVRFGFVIEPIPAADTCSSRPQDVGGRLRQKTERLDAEAQRWRREGRDPARVVGDHLAPLQEHMAAGRFTEAEAALDRALAALVTPGLPVPPDVGPAQPPPVPPTAGPAVADATPARVGEKLRRLHEAIAELVRQGRTQEAEAILEEALRRLR